MGELLLSREKLDEMENNPIFTLWLFGDVDESKLTEEEKGIIVARQMYYDLLLNDEDVAQVLSHLGCRNYSRLMLDRNLIDSASRFLSVRQDTFITKVTLMKKRHDKAKENKAKLTLKKED